MKLCCAAMLVACATLAACNNDSSPTTPTAPATCQYTVSTTAQTPTSDGGAFNVTVTKTSGSCTWAASSNASWVTFNGPATGGDSGTLNVVVAANSTTSARSGAVTVSWSGGSQQIAVNQNGLAFGNCVYSFAAPMQVVPFGGGPSGAALTVGGSGCTWTATSDQSWLTITSNASGTASATIGFTVAANNDAVPRTATITVTYPTGSTKLTISQDGVANCSYTLAPTTQSVPAAGGSFSFVPTRNTPNGCSFSASTSTPWITFTSPTTGLSGQAVNYDVAANTTGASRTGTISVGWSGGVAALTVTQTP